MSVLREKLSTQLLTGKEKLSSQLLTGKERMRASHEKLKLRVKVVGSKLREEGPRGARRSAWCFLAAALFYQGWKFNAILSLFLGLAFLVFLLIPVLFRFTPFIQSHIVFLPFIRMMRKVDFTSPKDEGVGGSRNLYLESEPGIKIGLWQVLPSSRESEGEGEDEEWWSSALGDGKTVILYLHGNTSHRAGRRRKELYQVLRSQDFHVVAPDYRGYADSSSHVAPTETGVVRDARAVYEWVAARAKGRLIVWGHSLGTAVSSHLVANLCQQQLRPSALVLEAPFNNIFDEVRNHPMGWLWRKMPFYDWFFTVPLRTNDFGFVSDQRIKVIDVPILFLHAEDDWVVPYRLGRTLYEAAIEQRPSSWPEVEWRGFSGSRGYAHNHICRAPELPEILRNFQERCKSEISPKMQDEAEDLSDGHGADGDYHNDQDGANLHYY